MSYFGDEQRIVRQLLQVSVRELLDHNPTLGVGYLCHRRSSLDRLFHELEFLMAAVALWRSKYALSLRLELRVQI